MSVKVHFAMYFRDKHNAIRKKMDNLVYKRIAVNIVAFHLSVHVFQQKSKIELYWLHFKISDVSIGANLSYRF